MPELDLRFRKFLLLIAVLALASAAHAADPVVATVSDVQGKAALVRTAAREPLALLADLAAGAQIELDANARAVVLYLDGSGEYAFRGPALVAIGPREPQVLKGAAAEKRVPLGGRAGKEVRLKSAGVVQAAIVMRSPGPQSQIRLVTPAGTHTLEAPRDFRWTSEEAPLVYRFELADDTGRVVYAADVRGNSLELPQSVKLSEGTLYTWSVSARLPGGRHYSSVGDFSIAPESVRRDAAALKPAPDAPFSDRVAYALWLDQADLKDEARRYWRALAAEKPGDTRLEALARE